MKRRKFLQGSFASAALIMRYGVQALAQPAKVRNIVLVHGLFADGSCWSEVVPLLQSRGLNVTAVQNPLTTLEDAVAEVQRVLREQDGPAVLVAHSFAGVIISQVGLAENVSSLVYVAARAPDAGEDYAALAKRFPTPPASVGIIFDGEVGRLTENAFLQDFANGIPADKAKILYAVQQPFRKDLVATPTTAAAWHKRPTFYAVSAQDRTINPDLERFMANRMKARTIELPAGHLSMISHPKEMAALILMATTV